MNVRSLTAVSAASILIVTGSIHADVALEQQEWLGIDEQESLNEGMALLYLSCGHVNLMSKRYSSALDDYQKALNVLNGSNDNGIEFLILFGMVVAYDNLNLTDLCENTILQVRTLIDASYEEDDDIMQYTLPEEEADDRALTYLEALASMAPSIDIRNALLSFISEIFPSPWLLIHLVVILFLEDTI
jgi:tetratricopeptide (TPR) repeat protein